MICWVVIGVSGILGAVEREWAICRHVYVEGSVMDELDSGNGILSGFW